MLPGWVWCSVVDLLGFGGCVFWLICLFGVFGLGVWVVFVDFWVLK